MAKAREYIVLGGLNLGAPTEDGPHPHASLLGLLGRLGPDGGLELVLNGDLLDAADSILARGGSAAGFAEGDSLERVRAVVDAHTPIMAALTEFMERGNRVTWLPGEGDADLLWPEAREALQAALGEGVGRKFRFQLRQGMRLPGGVWVEHGNQRVAPDALPNLEDPISKGQVRVAATTRELLERYSGAPEAWKDVRHVRPRAVATGDLEQEDVGKALEEAASEILEDERIRAVVFGYQAHPREPENGQTAWWDPGPWPAHGDASYVKVTVEGGSPTLELVRLGAGAGEGGVAAPAADAAAAGPSVLLAAADPTGDVGEAADPAPLAAKLKALGATVNVIEDASYDALVDALGGGGYDVLHVAAPSRVTPRRVAIQLRRANGGADLVGSDDFSDLLLGTGVRLLVLEVAGGTRPAGGIDEHLGTVEGLEAVVGFHDPEPSAEALRDATLAFYSAVGSGQGVAEAAEAVGAQCRGIADGGGITALDGMVGEAEEEEAPAADEGSEVEEPPAAGGAPTAELARIEEAMALPEGLAARALARLGAGREIVLWGPPRTGKSTLAALLAEAEPSHGRAIETVDAEHPPIGLPALVTGARVLVGPTSNPSPEREAELVAALGSELGDEEAAAAFAAAVDDLLRFITLARDCGAGIGVGAVLAAAAHLATVASRGAELGLDPVSEVGEAIVGDVLAALRGLDEKRLSNLVKWASCAKAGKKAPLPPAAPLPALLSGLQSLLAGDDAGGK